jgi:branched-chain amino acid transport system permease protein
VKPFPQLEVLTGTIPMLGTQVLKTHLLVIIVTIIMLIFLNLFIMRTKTGKSIRAVAEDKDVAALMGINVDRTITITFITGAAMAGIAGLLFAIVFRQVHFYMGFLPGLKAFTAAVLGGIGSIPGAALGGLFLGLIEAVGPALILNGLGIPAPHQLSNVIGFTMLVMVLIFRPQGILGERLAEKKA